LGEAVAFSGYQVVVDLYPVRMQLFDELIAFAPWDSGVLGSADDQQRCADLIGRK
jgi:hypothetical protein